MIKKNRAPSSIFIVFLFFFSIQAETFSTQHFLAPRSDISLDQPDFGDEANANLPVVYIDNYMVLGFKREHRILGGPRNVPLSMGIERVRRGIVITDRLPDADYLGYLQRLGLYDPDAVTILPVSRTLTDPTLVERLLKDSALLEQLKGMDLNGYRLDTFGMSEVIHEGQDPAPFTELSRQLGIPWKYHFQKASWFVNKIHVRNWIEAHPVLSQKIHQIPVVVHVNLADLTLEALRGYFSDLKTERLLIKDPVATANSGNFILGIRDLSPSILNTIRNRLLRPKHEGQGADRFRFYIERFVPVQISPSVTVEITLEKKVIIHSVQNQIFDPVTGRISGFGFPGGISRDIFRELVQTARWIGTALADEGYYGFITPDFVVDPDGKIWLIEINMRRGGSSVAQNVASRLNGGSVRGTSYVSSYMRVPFATEFNEVLHALGDLNYNPSTGNGVLLVEAGRFRETGKFDIVSILRKENAPDEVLEQLERARQRIQGIPVLTPPLRPTLAEAA